MIIIIISLLSVSLATIVNFTYYAGEQRYLNTALCLPAFTYLLQYSPLALLIAANLLLAGHAWASSNYTKSFK